MNSHQKSPVEMKLILSVVLFLATFSFIQSEDEDQINDVEFEMDELFNDFSEEEDNPAENFLGGLDVGVSDTL